jgi:hypothetical protein
LLIFCIGKQIEEEFKQYFYATEKKCFLTLKGCEATNSAKRVKKNQTIKIPQNVKYDNYW